jgi:hypothetical protein
MTSHSDRGSGRVDCGSNDWDNATEMNFRELVDPRKTSAQRKAERLSDLDPRQTTFWDYLASR